MNRNVILVAVAVCVAAAAAVVIGSAGAEQAQPPTADRGDRGELFDGPFVSSAATKNGESYSFVKGTRLRLEFVRDEGKSVLRWRAGCNYYGSPVRITESHLDVRLVESTDIGCSPALARQDRWLARFFSADPAWTLEGETLRLRSGDDRLRLKQK